MVWCKGRSIWDGYTRWVCWRTFVAASRSSSKWIVFCCCLFVGFVLWFVVCSNLYMCCFD